MPNLTNVEAQAVNTVEWLSADMTIAVPVYQRHYRWDLNACGQLLEDILAVADLNVGQTHFIGSILATATTTNGVTDMTLIDGQQRVATLMLLIAALRNGATHLGEDLDQPKLDMMLRDPVRPDEAKLRPHRVGADVFADIVLGRELAQDAMGLSVFDDNYLFFLNELQADGVQERVWIGLNRLEHVAITLKENANPQQIFESLNSTGAPLANYELIHNYILMGLSHSQQTQIEESFWVPIEENSGEFIDSFWRDYLIMRTGRDTDFTGVHGVYDAFRRQFPRLRFEELTNEAQGWKEYSSIYRILLDPAHIDDQEIKTHLGYINIFGGQMYPFLLAAFRDYLDMSISKSSLIEILDRLQSLWLRRMVVGQSRDHLAAQLCRRRLKEERIRTNDILRGTPSDERIRSALRYRSVPHAGYVLRRIERFRFPDDEMATELPAGFEIEHVFPQAPAEDWSGDGHRLWGGLSEDERARYRETLHTLGNIALLEQPLNAGASNKSFHVKRDEYYVQSAIPSIKHLARTKVWDAAAIEGRTAELTEKFLAIWSRPQVEPPLGGHVPVVDIPRGGRGQKLKTEFEYALFGEEVWEVHNIRELRARLYQHLLNTMRGEVLEYDASHHSNYPNIRDRKDRGFIFDSIGGPPYLYSGLWPDYLLGDIQQLVEELDLRDQLLVKYTADEE